MTAFLLHFAILAGKHCMETFRCESDAAECDHALQLLPFAGLTLLDPHFPPLSPLIVPLTTVSAVGMEQQCNWKMMPNEDVCKDGGRGDKGQGAHGGSATRGKGRTRGMGHKGCKGIGGTRGQGGGTKGKGHRGHL